MSRGYLVCVVRGRECADTPEERVRQAFAGELMHYGYRREDLVFELPVKMGSDSRRVDIAIFSPRLEAEKSQQTVYIVIECKRADVSKAGFEEAKRQLFSYMDVSPNCHYGVLVAGSRRVCVEKYRHADGRRDKRVISALPAADLAPRLFTRFGDTEPATKPRPLPMVSSRPRVKQILVGVVGAVVLVAGLLSWANERPRAADASGALPRSHSPPVAVVPKEGASPGEVCRLAPWDGKVRAWDKRGSTVCKSPGAQPGFFLRVALGSDRPTSVTQVQNAWAWAQRALGSPCPAASEMVFFTSKREAGAGLLFREKPANWDSIQQSKPDWLLRDAADQMVASEVCFYSVDEARRAVGWDK